MTLIFDIDLARRKKERGKRGKERRAALFSLLTSHFSPLSFHLHHKKTEDRRPKQVQQLPVHHPLSAEPLYAPFKAQSLA